MGLGHKANQVLPPIRPVVDHPTGRDQISAMPNTPTLGVEEEFLLVDPASGAPVARNKAVAERAAEHDVELQLELTSCQIETATGVVDDASDLREQLVRLRRTAAERTRAQLLAVGLPPTLPREFPSPTSRVIATSASGST